MASKVLTPLSSPNLFLLGFSHVGLDLPFLAFITTVSVAGRRYPKPFPNVVVEIHIYMKINGSLEI